MDQKEMKRRTKEYAKRIINYAGHCPIREKLDSSVISCFGQVHQWVQITVQPAGAI